MYINDKLLNNMEDYIFDRKENMKWYFFDFSSDSKQDLDPFFHEKDLWIQLKLYGSGALKFSVIHKQLY